MSKNITNSTENVSQNITTLNLTPEELNLVLEGLERSAADKRGNILYSEGTTAIDRQVLSLDVENIRLLQGSIIKQKRIALGVISE
jgi:hypothetical protein